VTDINVSEGELVWYNERKGYGFVRIGDTEVFLHRSTLDRFGLVRLLTGDKVTVSLTVNEHGEVRAVVKFFNDIRGYGFVTSEDIGEGVLSIRVC
jgi:CspA family cold shock protein